jgi:hypothetical protein
LSIFQTSNVLSRCVHSVKRRMARVLIKQCGKHTHVFWAEEHLGKFIDYLRQSSTFAERIRVISHNTRGYDAHLLLRKFLELRWTPQLIINSTIILTMFVENLHLSLNFLPMSLKRMHKSFDLTWKRGTTLSFLIRPRIWTMWALIPNPNSMAQTTCQAMSEPNFLQWYEEEMK